MNHHELSVKPLQTTFDNIKQPEMVTKWRLPKLHFKLLACGPSGSGKSTAVINLLNMCYQDSFKKVWLIGPTAKIDKVWDGLKINNYNKRSRRDNISVTEFKKIFKDGLRSVKRNGHTGPKTLIIFEDFINTTDPESGKLFLNSHEVADLTLVGRHAAISLVFLTQVYNKLPRRLRENCSHVIYLPSKHGENIRLADDYCPPRRSKQWMLNLVMEATKPDSENSHPFLFIDVHGEPEFKFRKNFDLLIHWTDDDDRATMGQSKSKFQEDRPKEVEGEEDQKILKQFSSSFSAEDDEDDDSLLQFLPQHQKKKKKRKKPSSRELQTPDRKSRLY